MHRQRPLQVLTAELAVKPTLFRLVAKRHGDHKSAILLTQQGPCATLRIVDVSWKNADGSLYDMNATFSNLARNAIIYA